MSVFFDDLAEIDKVFEEANKVLQPNAQLEYFGEFSGKMKERLELGREKYGDKSFLTDNVIQDMKEEILDFANYAYLLYERICRLEKGEKASDYLNLCRAVDMTGCDEANELLPLLKKFGICHRYNGREFHYCKKG